MFDFPIHVIDFEGSRQSGIVEYGVVSLQGREITSTSTRLCEPIGTISDHDRMQHGISELAAAQYERFDVEWDFFAGLRESGPLCAHNVSVEDGLLSVVWPFPRLSPDFSGEGGAAVNSWGPWLDTLYLYRRIYPNLDSYKLSDLIELFDQGAVLKRQAQLCCPERRGQYHCALFDALASALLLIRLYDEPALEAMSLHWMLINSASSEEQKNTRGQQELF